MTLTAWVTVEAADHLHKFRSGLMTTVAIFPSLRLPDANQHRPLNATTSQTPSFYRLNTFIFPPALLREYTASGWLSKQNRL